MHRKLITLLPLLCTQIAAVDAAVADQPTSSAPAAAPAPARPVAARPDAARPVAARPVAEKRDGARPAARPVAEKPAAPTPAGKPDAARGAAKAGAEPAVPLVVPTAWLAAHLSDKSLVLLHVGDADGYRAKHIAGARLVALSDISISMQGPDQLHLELPPPDDLRQRFEKLGISNDSRIVVYFGEDWVSPATRVVLTLDAAGLGDRAGLLDGGMPAWVRDGHPVTDAAAPVRTGKLAPLAMKPIIVNATTVLSSLGKPGVAVIDARDRTYYDGTETGSSHDKQHRTGHIAGAHSVPFSSVFDDKLVLLSTDELTARFTQAGVAPGDTIIGYCHIGQQATAMLFAARRLGHPVLLYDGSFEDWSLHHPGYPVEKSPGVPDAPSAPQPDAAAKAAAPARPSQPTQTRPAKPEGKP
jgi:thiosulfate/3-mercaptopyruvate sulfurtransferase